MGKPLEREQSIRPCYGSFVVEIRKVQYTKNAIAPLYIPSSQQRFPGLFAALYQDVQHHVHRPLSLVTSHRTQQANAVGLSVAPFLRAEEGAYTAYRLGLHTKLAGT